MLTRPDDINNEEYWAYRLEESEKAAQPQYAVYLINPTGWNSILQEHLKIIEKEITKKSSVLDAGCGTARMSEYFGDKYVGVDFAPAFINKAKELYPNRKLIVSKLEKLPFKDKEFDWAMCISVRQMVIGKSSQEHWDRMEKELIRVSNRILYLEYSNPNEYEIFKTKTNTRTRKKNS